MGHGITEDGIKDAPGIGCLIDECNSDASYTYSKLKEFQRITDIVRDLDIATGGLSSSRYCSYILFNSEISYESGALLGLCYNNAALS